MPSVVFSVSSNPVRTSLYLNRYFNSAPNSLIPLVNVNRLSTVMGGKTSFIASPTATTIPQRPLKASVRPVIRSFRPPASYQPLSKLLRASAVLLITLFIASLTLVHSSLASSKLPITYSQDCVQPDWSASLRVSIS